jgi:hypothetical protein
MVYDVHSGDTGDVTKLDIFCIYFYLFHTAVNNYDRTSEQECVFPLLKVWEKTPLAALMLNSNGPSRNRVLSFLRSKK